MKLEYDLTDNYTKYYNEAQGVFLVKDKLKKNVNKKVKVNGYLQTMIMWGVIIILVQSLTEVLNVYNPSNTISIFRFAMAFVMFLVLFAIAVFIVGLKQNAGSKKGTLEITEKGIVDTSEEGVQVLIPYDKLEFIVFSENLMVGVTSIQVLLFIQKDIAGEVVAEIKKYADVPVINEI